MHSNAADPRSRFTPDVTSLLLAPDERGVVTLTALLDDTAPFSDELLVAVTESGTMPVPLAARGTGQTLHCEPAMGRHDFGPIFTNTPATTTFVLENRGRRNQTVQWVNLTHGDGRKARAASTSDGAAGAGGGGAAAGGRLLFAVEPPTAVIKPGVTTTFTVKGISDRPGDVTESIECQVRGESERNFSTMATLQVHADFVHPLLQFSPPALDFSYYHTAENEVADPATGVPPSVVQHVPLTLTNASALPLEFSLRTAAPFALDQADITLAAGATTTVTVSFDPMYRDDRLVSGIVPRGVEGVDRDASVPPWACAYALRDNPARCALAPRAQSHAVDGRITATYKDHPRRDVVPCKGDINFPNVALDRTAVDFGCLLNDTVASQTVVVTNVTKLPLDLGWSFVWDEATAVAEAEAAGLPYIPVNKVFDVRPLRCHLLPGDTMPVDFVYYGHPGRRFATTAVCEIAGGPEYAVRAWCAAVFRCWP